MTCLLCLCLHTEGRASPILFALVPVYLVFWSYQDRNPNVSFFNVCRYDRMLRDPRFTADSLAACNDELLLHFSGPPSGRTVLHWACANGMTSLARALMCHPQFFYCMVKDKVCLLCLSLESIEVCPVVSSFSLPVHSFHFIRGCCVAVV